MRLCLNRHCAQGADGSRRDPDTQMNVERLASELGGLSRNHLHKIVQELAALGALRTVRGAGGGVILAKPLSEIRLRAGARPGIGPGDRRMLPRGWRLRDRAGLPAVVHAAQRARGLLRIARPPHAGRLSRRAEPSEEAGRAGRREQEGRALKAASFSFHSSWLVCGRRARQEDSRVSDDVHGLDRGLTTGDRDFCPLPAAFASRARSACRANCWTGRSSASP